MHSSRRCVPPAEVAVGGRGVPVDRHTPVNILPCPKLRLRAVTNHKTVFTSKMFLCHDKLLKVLSFLNLIYLIRFLSVWNNRIFFSFCFKPQQDMSHDLYTLRFEDLAAAPFHYTRKLYSFLGINLHPNVTQFITKSTNYTGSDHDRPFSTQRNSTKVLERWRHVMPWRMVKRVQEVCSVVMETLHYSPAVSESALRDLSVELTRPYSVFLTEHRLNKNALQ